MVNAVQIICLLGYVLTTFYTSSLHEMFADEADPWTFVRDASWQQAKLYFADSGHPPLWHAILFPFARLGFPVETMQYINAFFASVTAYFILFHGRMPLLLKVAIICTFSFGYQYAVVARGYMLMLMLLSMVAMLYPTRKARPICYFALLGLLCNTETYVIIMAAGLALQFGLELLFESGFNMRSIAAFFKNTRYMLATGICFALCLLCLIALLPTKETRRQLDDVQIKVQVVEKTVAGGFFPKSVPKIIQRYTAIERKQLRGILGGLGVAILLSVMLSLSCWKLRLIYIASMLWPMVIFSSVYFGWAHHHMLYPLVSVMFLWVDQSTSQKNVMRRYVAYVTVLLLSFSFFSSSYDNVRHHQRDIASDYSPEKRIAAYILDHGLEKESHILFLCWNVSVVPAYLPETSFWTRDSPHTFSTWSRTHRKRCVHSLKKPHKSFSLAMKQMGTDTLYTISAKPIKDVDGYEVEKLFSVKAKIRRSKFFIYKVTKSQ